MKAGFAPVLTEVLAKNGIKVMKWFPSLTLVIFTLLCLSGCVSLKSTPYPEQWKEAKSNVCTSLEGAYNNVGELVPEQKECDTLFSLMGLSGVSNRPNEHISISFVEKNTLMISGQKDSKRLFGDKNEYACLNGKLQISRSFSHIESEGWGPYTGEHAVLLSRGVDGSLIVKWKESSSGIIGWLIPYYSNKIYWCKFSSVQQ